jgi:hypothetical protein
MPDIPFHEVWERIRRDQRERFYTKTRLPFTYEIRGEVVHVHRPDSPSDNKQPYKSQFELAYQRVPIPNPGKIRDIVWGCSYVWAILHDPRISQGDW